MDDLMKRKSLLIYAHYYVPDVASTGQILQELAEGLQKYLNVTVICTVPSYTGKIADEYKQKRFYHEEINGVKVIRIRVPEFNKRKKISRVKNILAYFFGALYLTFHTGKEDYVFSISQPPILGGVLGRIGKKVKHAKFIYNIQDFNPEQINAIEFSKKKLLLKALMSIDKHSCRKADKVIVVGRDMITTLKKRFQGKKVPVHAYINNWIDEDKIYPLPKDDENVQEFRNKYHLSDKTVIMYSGNIGLYYDLENILEVIGRFKDENDVIFAFVGEGSRLAVLKSYTAQHNLKNVVFIPYQKKEELNYSLNAADIQWCISAKGIKGVSVPSKLYGIIAAAKPVIAVLEKDAEARLIIEETKCGLVCEPGDYDTIESMIRNVINKKDSMELEDMGKRGRSYLLKNLTMQKSVSKYYREITNC